MSKDSDNYLSSVITLLNCALTDDPFCAFPKSSYNYVVGDSRAGKTYFIQQLFAEAAHDENFDDYDLIFDEPEDGALMDRAELFGEVTEERVRPPFMIDDETWGSSETVEEMYSRAKKAFKNGPCIQAVDSMDALTSLAELKKSEKIADAIEDEADTKGIMSDGKAKVNSMMLRQIMKPMKKHGSLLFIISQTRDSVGQLFSTKTRSGGKALRFYATTEIWFSIKKPLKRTIKKKEREVGNIIQISVKKNRNSSQCPTIEVPFLHDYGFDDIGCCIGFLVDNGHWKGDNKIVCPEFSSKPVARTDLIKYIEEKSARHDKLRVIVGEVWNEVREATKPKRKKRYG
jgi:RecA/RadA recombinase